MPQTTRQGAAMRFTDDFPTGIGPNSWHLKLPLKACKGALPYHWEHSIEAYQCQCGHFELNPDIIPYRCPQCDNEYFHNAHMPANHANELIINIEHFVPILQKHQNGHHALVFTHVPTHVDINRNCLEFERLEVLHLHMDCTGHLHSHSEYRPSDYVKRRLLKELFQFIGEELNQIIPNWNTLNFYAMPLETQQRAIAFFLQHPELDGELFFWAGDAFVKKAIKEATTPISALDKLINGRQEKSIRRTLFARYSYELRFNEFDMVFPFIVSRIFRDTNRLCRLLAQHHLTFAIDSHHQDFDASDLISFFTFLKNHYEEKELEQIICQIPSATSLWLDILHMYETAGAFIEAFFHRGKASLQSIYNECVKFANFHNFNDTQIAIIYETLDCKACITTHGLTFLLPASIGEIIHWSQELHNCLYRYVNKIYRRKTTVYGVFRNNLLVYAVEVCTEGIVQMSGKYNSRVNTADQTAITYWFDKYVKNSESLNPD